LGKVGPKPYPPLRKMEPKHSENGTKPFGKMEPKGLAPPFLKVDYNY